MSDVAADDFLVRPFTIEFVTRATDSVYTRQGTAVIALIADEENSAIRARAAAAPRADARSVFN
eukprot:3168151-Pleurochrysis_carterae.AAC.3